MPYAGNARGTTNATSAILSASYEGANADEQTPFVHARSVKPRIAQPIPDPGNISLMAVVRQAQVKIGETAPYAAWIDVDDLPNVNTHHFSASTECSLRAKKGPSRISF